MADKFFVESKREKSGQLRVKHNFAWIICCIVLALIALTFVLPAAGLGAIMNPHDGVVFGQIGKRKVRFSESSFMYMVYQNYRDQMSSMFSGGDDSFLNQYSMQQAYRYALVREGELDIVEKSGDAVCDDAVNDYIKKQFVDDKGEFLRDGWASISQNDRDRIRKETSDEVAVNSFTSALSTPKSSAKNAEFIAGFIPRSKRFSALVFIGDDAEQKSQEALSALKAKGDIEALAKTYEKTVVEADNVLEKDFAFIQGPSRSGDLGKFYQAMDDIPTLRAELFALKDGEVYGQVVSINDTEKLVVKCIGDASEETLNANKSAAQNAFSNNWVVDMEELIYSSPSHKNYFTKSYDKYFR